MPPSRTTRPQVSTVIANARPLDVLTFQQAVMDGFAAVFDQLGPAGAVHPVRFWAFVPVGTRSSMALRIPASSAWPWAF